MCIPPDCQLGRHAKWTLSCIHGLQRQGNGFFEQEHACLIKIDCHCVQEIENMDSTGKGKSVGGKHEVHLYAWRAC